MSAKRRRGKRRGKGRRTRRAAPKPAGAGETRSPAGPAEGRSSATSRQDEPRPEATPKDERLAAGRERLALLGLFLLALAVRLPGLASDLWLDEVASLVHFVKLPLPELFVTYVSANNHVLYSILAHLSIALFGESSWAYRLPAALFGAATPPALYFLARRTLGRPEALASGVILALSYHHAYFSQNGRGYTGMILFAIVTTLLLVRALDTDRTRTWAAWSIVTAVSAWLLLSGIFVCVAQVLGALLVAVLPVERALRRRRLLRLATWTSLAAGLTILIYLPLMPSMLDYFATADRNVGWKPSLELLRVVMRDAAPNPLFAVGALVAAPIAIAGLVSLARRAPLVLFGLALPPVLELLVALGMGVGTYPRRFLLVLPFALLVAVEGAAIAARLAARALSRPDEALAPEKHGPDEVLRGPEPRREEAPRCARLERPIFAALVAAGALVAAAGLPRLWTTPKQDYSGALAYVEERREPGDVVAAAYIAELGTTYLDPEVESARTAEELREVLERGRRTWLVGTFLADMEQRAPALDALVERRFEEVARFEGLVGDGDVVVWRSRYPGQPKRPGVGPDGS